MNSNILGIDTNLEDNAYLYDKLDRVTADAINADIPIEFSYDLNDNRFARNLADSSRQDAYLYAPASNRLTSVETFTPSGPSPVVPKDRELIYNDASRLYQLIESGVLKAEYFYNDEGQRTRKVVYEADGITVDSVTVFHYDAMGYLITETDEAGALIRDYIWTENMHPVAQIDKLPGSDEDPPSEVVSYLYTDHLMTNRLATDAFQQVIWRWEGEAFGNTPAEELAGISVNLRFPGQYFDQETNLHYNWYRYYDPELGRYITSDPIGLGGGVNTYGYVLQNPFAYTDIKGLEIVGRFLRDSVRLTYIKAVSPWEPIYPGELKGPLPKVSMWNVEAEFGGAYAMLVKCKEIECGETIREGFVVETEYVTGLRHTFTIHVGVMGRAWMRMALGAGMIYAEYKDIIDAMIKARTAVRMGVPSSLCKRNSFWYPTIPNYFETISDAPL